MNGSRDTWITSWSCDRRGQWSLEADGLNSNPVPRRLAAIPAFRLVRVEALVTCTQVLGVLGGHSGKESACQCRRHQRLGFNPRLSLRDRAWGHFLSGLYWYNSKAGCGKFALAVFVLRLINVQTQPAQKKSPKISLGRQLGSYLGKLDCFFRGLSVF